ncbi:hypothetical protein CTAM01_06024 [Colletotrichum tamarilloi]|uniref:Uncharacterized protein n=1 Tax=Colletotrichum tamarilloi TaxID=1209934 RepID=A0ABQ9RCV1_9PEZI|nr:uncharacterized protein CTAM01_06024 [Colletotrichum tamarilloi]KAK1501299.1 hypothetical protein CTAM01_06024 [Colletotrichum tamarilloi]
MKSLASAVVPYQVISANQWPHWRDPGGSSQSNLGGRLRSSVTLPSGMVYYLTGLRKSNRNSRDLSQISASHLRNDGQPDRVLVSKREGE